MTWWAWFSGGLAVLHVLLALSVLLFVGWVIASLLRGHKRLSPDQEARRVEREIRRVHRATREQMYRTAQQQDDQWNGTVIRGEIAPTKEARRGQ